MPEYIKILVKELSPFQKSKITNMIISARIEVPKVYLRFTYDDLAGDDRTYPLFITSRQKKHIDRNLKQNRGSTIHLSGRLLRYNRLNGSVSMMKGGSISNTPVEFGMLDNFTIEKILDKDKYFRGAIPSDKKYFVGKPPENESGIVNFETDKEDGSHWVCYYVHKDQKYNIYFDSFGGVIPENIMRYLKRNGKLIMSNSFQLQAYNTVLCGFFCLNLIKWLNTGKDYQSYINLFSLDNLEKNDEITKNLFKKLFPEFS